MCGQNPAPERGGSHTVVLGKRLKGTFTDPWTSPGQPLRLHPVNAGLVGYTRWTIRTLVSRWRWCVFTRSASRHDFRSRATAPTIAVSRESSKPNGTVAGWPRYVQNSSPLRQLQSVLAPRVRLCLMPHSIVGSNLLRDPLASTAFKPQMCAHIIIDTYRKNPLPAFLPRLEVHT
jgi:hypothetical protein